METWPGRLATRASQRFSEGQRVNSKPPSDFQYDLSDMRARFHPLMGGGSVD